MEQAQDYLGLTLEQIARAADVDEHLLHGWRSGEVRPSPDSIARLEALDQLVMQMRRTFRVPQAARAWALEARADLDGRRPLDLILEARAEELRDVLEKLESETAA